MQCSCTLTPYLFIKADLPQQTSPMLMIRTRIGSTTCCCWSIFIETVYWECAFLAVVVITNRERWGE